MKFRNIVIMLLAILMAFAFASCSNEPNKPTPTPKPTPKDYYQIEVTEGVDKDYYNRDKIKIEWEVPVKAGDTISLKYRSERDIYQWDIRDGNLKWVYETEKNGFQDPILDEDGWYNLTYTFGNDINGATVASNSRFGIYFRGNFVTTDIFEIKDIMLNDEELEVETPNLKSYAKLNDPAEDFDWTVKNYTVLFATGQPGEVDKTPFAEKVVAGGFVTGAPVAKENYSLTIYTDEAKTPGNIFDPSTPITENKIFYYEYVGDPRTVSFVTNSNSVIQPMTVHYNDLIDPPEVEPELEGQAFKAWYIDAELKTAWNFDTDHIEDDLVLYAGYADPRTVTFVLNGGAFAEGVSNTKTVADGNTVGVPEAPTYGELLFLGWYKDAELKTAYDFSAPVTSDISIYAAWGEPVDITVNLNYEGAGTPKTFKAEYGKALSETDKNLAVEDKLIGLVFAGWYDDADCSETKKHDFSALVTAPFTLYAKWEEAPLYKLVATGNAADGEYSKDKLAIVHSTADVDDGDVLSFRFRTTRDFRFFSIRRAGGGKKWIYQNSNAEANYGFTSYETKADGWTYVTYKFDKATAVDSAEIPAEDADFEIHFGNRWNDPTGNTGIVAGDILEIQDWAINGVPMVIAAGDVTSYAGATVSVVEGGEYAWTDQTVNFAMGVADAIEDKTVAFGKTVEKPEDPVVEGYKFLGWFADAEFNTPFDFDCAITKATTIYASFKQKSGITYTVTFNPNFEGSSSKGVEVDEDDPVTAIKVGRPGYFLDGWYTAADNSGEKVDFSTYTATKNDELFAHWTAPTKKYVLTATIDKDEVDDNGTPEVSDDDTTYYSDRFQLRWKGDYSGAVKIGDVFTYMVKSIPVEGSSAVTRSRFRDRSGSKSYSSITALSEADDDGWIEMTLTVTQESTKDGILIDFRPASGSLAIGDKLEIMAVALNGKELPISTDSSSRGVYEGAKPTISEVSLVQ